MLGRTLGERIRRYRQGKGWTLKDLAAATKLSVPYLSDLERRSGVNPTLDTLTTVAEALGCSVRELLGGDEDEAEADDGLTPSLARFVRGDDFARRVQVIAERSQRPVEEVKPALIGFLARAPKRSNGELSPTDWQRLIDVYQVITGEA